LARLGDPVPEAYKPFVPEHPATLLDGIRARLDPGEIVEMAPVSVQPKVVPLPDDLPFSARENTAFRSIHRLLSEVGCVDNISYAGKAAAAKTRRDIIRLVWAFGRLGERREQGGPHLALDSETYLAQKIHSSFARVKSYLEAMGEYDARGEHVPLAKDGWLTPKNSLKRRGWYLKLSFEDAVGGALALDALQLYTAKLDEAYGKQAFRRFSRADMRVLLENTANVSIDGKGAGA
jgi:hypothetical protein